MCLNSDNGCIVLQRPLLIAMDWQANIWSLTDKQTAKLEQIHCSRVSKYLWQGCCVRDETVYADAGRSEALGLGIVDETTCQVLKPQFCKTAGRVLILMGMVLLGAAAYTLLTIYFLVSMLRQLRTLTYQANKINHVLVRLQVRLSVQFPP